jgi:hypothetical protein
MRRLFLIFAVLAASITATKAQFYIGGNLGFWYEKEYKTTFNISPDVGYLFNNHWAAGLSIGFEANIPYKQRLYVRIEDDGSIYTYTPKNDFYFYAAPYARFNYFSIDKFTFFLDGIVGVSAENSWRSNAWGFQVTICPGISINLTEHFSLEGTFGALGYWYNYCNTHGFGLKLSNYLTLGFYYSF